VTGDHLDPHADPVAPGYCWWPAADDEICSVCSEPAVVTDNTGVSYCWEHS
jgi:hypothetical protein